MKKKQTEGKVLHRLNPSLKLKTVTLLDGSFEYQRNCKLINGHYYRVDDQCVLVDKKWYPIGSTEIYYDWELLQYKRYKGFGSVKNGVVDYKDGMFVQGKFSPNEFRNCRIGILLDGGKKAETYCINYNIPKSLGYIEHINEDIWADKSFFAHDLKASDMLGTGLPGDTVKRWLSVYSDKQNDFTTIKEFKFNNNAYNAEESGIFGKRINDYNAFTPVLTKDVRRAARLIGDLSFGCEAEAKKGNIPAYYQAQLGLIICKDGSIGYTPEFVTVPYSGAKGLQSLKNLFIELNKRCTTDHSCSLHFHIGGIRKDREFIVALFKLYSTIQVDLHKMLPYYKTNPSGVKEKNYCQFLEPSLVDRFLKADLTYKDKVNEAYKSIFNWTLEGTSPNKKHNRKTKVHPNGRTKWSWHTRYMSLNVLNMFLSDRQTAEFRAHQGTLHPEKAINWLFICIAIVRYAENNSSKIISKGTGDISLTDVLMYYSNTFKTPYAAKVSEYLIAYYENRCEYFTKAKDLGDRVARAEYEEKDFSFEVGTMKEIF